MFTKTCWSVGLGGLANAGIKAAARKIKPNRTKIIFKVRLGGGQEIKRRRAEETKDRTDEEVLHRSPFYTNPVPIFGRTRAAPRHVGARLRDNRVHTVTESHFILPK